MSDNVTSMALHTTITCLEYTLYSILIMIDDNSKPLRARVVREFRYQEANDILHWPTMSFDMNPIEHARDVIGR